MITGDITLERGMSLEGRSSASGADHRPPGSDGSEFAAMLQEMTSQQEQEQRRSDLSALCGAASTSPMLEVPAEATRLNEAGVKSLVHMLWSAVMAGDETARVKLQPREMGTLVLNIQLMDDGVYVEARADDPRVVSLIRASILELAEGLAQRGLVLRGFRVGAGAPSRDDQEPEHQAAPPEEQVDPDDKKQNIDAPRRSFIEVVI